MSQSKMTRFGFEVEMLGDLHEVTWTRDGGEMIILGLSLKDAREVLQVLQNLDRTKATLEQCREMFATKKDPDTRPGPVKPAPYRGRDYDPPEENGPPEETTPDEYAPPRRERQVAEPMTLAVVKREPEPEPEPEEETPDPDADLPAWDNHGTPVADPDPDAEIKAKIEASEPIEIPPEARAKLEEMAVDVVKAADAVRTNGLDPKSTLEYYRQQKQGPKGGMTKREARSQVTFAPGGDYKGQTIIQAGVEDTAHGELWSLLLDNEDQVLVSFTGTEVEYYCAAQEVLPGMIDPAQTSAEQPPPETSPDPPAPTAADPMDPPAELLESRKMNKLMAWVIENAHPAGVDSARLVDQMWALQPRAKSLKAATSRDKVERRVIGSLATLGIEVKDA